MDIASGPDIRTAPAKAVSNRFWFSKKKDWDWPSFESLIKFRKSKSEVLAATEFKFAIKNLTFGKMSLNKEKPGLLKLSS